MAITMQIGQYQFHQPVILAPMAGVTDRPFRQLCKNLGATLAISEMVSSNSLLWGSEKTQKRSNHEGETRPCSVQIMGADPDMMAQAAKWNVERGAEIIDINMGCPAKKVCNVAAGSALLKDETLVNQILEAIVSAVDVPVTLKIRTGWDKQHKNAVKIAQIAEQQGIQALAIHGRTRACAYSGGAEYDTIRAVKQKVNIPVIANGDITTPEKAKQVLEQTGADAIMIGRAAQGKPWIFREIQHYLNTGQHLTPPTVTEICEIMLNHLENLYQFHGEAVGTKIARKHLAWYSKGQAQGAKFRQQINKVNNSQQQIQMTLNYFQTLS